MKTQPMQSPTRTWFKCCVFSRVNTRLRIHDWFSLRCCSMFGDHFTIQETSTVLTLSVILQQSNTAVRVKSDVSAAFTFDPFWSNNDTAYFRYEQTPKCAYATLFYYFYSY